MAMNEDIKRYQQEGWIDRQEAMKMTGHSESSSLDRDLKKAGVHNITIPWSNSKNGEKGKVLYRKTMVAAYAANKKMTFAKPVAGESNGGKLMKEIADLRSRIVDLQEDNAELELRIVTLEKRMNETRIAQMTAAM